MYMAVYCDSVNKSTAMAQGVAESCKRIQRVVSNLAKMARAKKQLVEPKWL